MTLRNYISFTLILIGVIFIGILVFRWQLNVMEKNILENQKSMSQNMSSQFRQLNDSMSVQSSVKVIQPPGWFDKLFNTALEKQYDAIRNEIPKTIQDEISKIKLENKQTTVNQTVIQMEGDSVVFKNSEGTVISSAKVVPLNSDSSMLLILPQEIELTNVSIQPDQNNPDSVFVFLSAMNKTTGKQLQITRATTYVLPGSKKKWTFNTMPFVGASYDVLNREFILRGGFLPIQFNGKGVRAQLLGVEFNYGHKSQVGVELEILQIQLKPRK
jgi:hypothetical protein